MSKQAQASPGAGDWRYASSPWMQGAGQPQAVRAWLGVDTAEWPVLERDGWRIVFHFGGARRRAVLDLMKSEAIVNANAWFFVSRSPVASIKDELRRFIPPMEAERRIAEGLARLERLLGRPLSNAELPTDLRIREVREWLALDAERDVFAAAKLSEATEEHRLSVLRAVEGASAQGR